MGIGKVESEDSVRRALKQIGAENGTSWLQDHLDDTARPLLSEPWMLDCDTTIKQIYDHQEGAVVSYNPKKPGRPSHACHAFLMAGTRLVLDVEVRRATITVRGARHRPCGRCSTASGGIAGRVWGGATRIGAARETWRHARRRVLDYLCKLRLTKGTRRLAERLMARDGWEDAGQGWSGITADLRLQGWRWWRRVVMLLRRLPATLALMRGDNAQGNLLWTEAQPGAGVWEFPVLATSLDLEIPSLAQLYRDRADAENSFDELKNQWGGFTARDLIRCRHMARLIALIYNWWSLFVRLGRS